MGLPDRQRSLELEEKKVVTVPERRRFYLFDLDYGNREREYPFIKDILNSFNKDELTGCGVAVNNNPYNLEFILFCAFEENADKFERFLKNYYPERRVMVNYFLSDIMSSLMSRGYNVSSFIDADDVDGISDMLFLFLDRESMEKQIKSLRNDEKSLRVFISHSSKDKDAVDAIFERLQQAQIRAWYDKYEIMLGDSITDKINEGLVCSDLGIICISPDFLNSESGWTKAELNYLVSRRMRNETQKFIIVNLGVPHEELPPLVRDYKYLNFSDEGAIEALLDSILRLHPC